MAYHKGEGGRMTADERSKKLDWLTDQLVGQNGRRSGWDNARRTLGELLGESAVMPGLNPSPVPASNCDVSDDSPSIRHLVEMHRHEFDTVRFFGKKINRMSQEELMAALIQSGKLMESYLKVDSSRYSFR